MPTTPAAPCDKHGNVIAVGARVRILGLSGEWFDRLPSDEKQDIFSMVGETFEVEEIDEYGSPWVRKSWPNEAEGTCRSHSITLDSHEMELVGESAPMSVEAVAAERTWFAVAPDGTEHDVVLRIGVPTHASSGEWRAAVSFGVLESRTYAIAGIDPWQAVCLAMRFAATRVGHFDEDGWRFYWERGGELASATELTNVP